MEEDGEGEGGVGEWVGEVGVRGMGVSRRKGDILFFGGRGVGLGRWNRTGLERLGTERCGR